MDFHGFDLEFRGPAGIPGTLQLSVLVPVLLNAPRRSQEEVAGGDLSLQNHASARYWDHLDLR